MRILWRSITLFRLVGIPVQMHTTFLAWPLAFFAWIGWKWNGLSGIAAAMGILLLLYTCLLMHEFAHILVARRYGGVTARVLLIPFGCVADMESIPREPYEIWIALAGPLTSVALAALAWLAYKAIPEPATVFLWRTQSIVLMIAVSNIVVAGFNMLPAFPLDGGRVARSVITLLIGLVLPGQAYRARVAATRIAVRYITWPVALGIIVLTILYTHIWTHLIVFGFLILAGEAEFWLLKKSPELMTEPTSPASCPSPFSPGIDAAPATSRQRLRGMDIPLVRHTLDAARSEMEA